MASPDHQVILTRIGSGFRLTYLPMRAGQLLIPTRQAAVLRRASVVADAVTRSYIELTAAAEVRLQFGGSARVVRTPVQLDQATDFPRQLAERN